MTKLSASAKDKLRSDFLESVPGILSGRVVFINSRLPVDIILGMLGNDYSVKDIFHSYPQLKRYLKDGLKRREEE